MQSMEVMNCLLLCCALHSVELVIVDTEKKIVVRQMSIHVTLESIKEIEFIPIRSERQLEYGRLLAKTLIAISPLEKDNDYSFTFNFHSNGMEHCEATPIAAKLREMYCIRSVVDF
eukprot:TRINITY_DN13140_c0_g1_i1.p1 TRINITY_DN13140_c0_g1~~TRINITY_DN13140_c0_g1_i1.p1  ORF type:complete len:116 (+),score=1.17 TRINITY_DN13140_c0_g1_i1:103-450(+)